MLKWQRVFSSGVRSQIWSSERIQSIIAGWKMKVAMWSGMWLAYKVWGRCWQPERKPECQSYNHKDLNSANNLNELGCRCIQVQALSINLLFRLYKALSWESSWIWLVSSTDFSKTYRQICKLCWLHAYFVFVLERFKEKKKKNTTLT